MGATGGDFFKKILRSRSRADEAPPGIHIYLYHDHNTSSSDIPIYSCTEFGKEYTAEDLCQQVANELLTLTSLTFPLFALASKDLSILYPPDEVITAQKDASREFVFRLAFRPTKDNLNRIAVMDTKAFNYIFLQCRDDFINNRLEAQFVANKVGREKKLGLAVWDMLRFGVEKDCKLEALKKCGADFIPSAIIKSSSSAGAFISKKRFTVNMIPALESAWEKYQKAPTKIEKVKWTFIDTLWGYVPNYLEGRFKYHDPNEGDRVLVVDLYHPEVEGKRCDGIYFTGVDTKKATVDHFCTISDLMSAEINLSSAANGTQVMILRKEGPPKCISLSDPAVAKSLVMLLCGYYRLVHNWYSSLCDHLTSPLLKEMKQIRSHGPIRRDIAKKKKVPTATLR